MNLAIISSWHVHAKDYIRQLKRRSDCRITAFWDSDEEQGKKWAEELHCHFVADYDELLSDLELDGVVIVSPTVMHKELILKAAAAGKHIFTEKVLAFTKQDALEIKEAIEKNQVRFGISLPHKSKGEVVLAKKMLEEGAFGTVTYARVRNAHDGSSSGWLPPHFYCKKECGGGAMMDLGAHPMYLLAWLLGMPERITSVFSTPFGKEVEENAVCVFLYQNGIIAVSETSFVSKNNPFTLEISGTKGSLLIHNGLFYATENTQNQWVQADMVPEDLPLPIDLWLDESPLCYGIQDAVDLSELMEKAYAAAGEPYCSGIL